MDTTMTILEAVIQVLQEQNKPLHYKELAELITKQALCDIPGKDKGYTVYYKIYYDIKDFPLTTVFEFFKKGVFGLKGMTVEDLKQHVPKRNRKSKNPEKQYALERMKEQLLGQEPKCGNCKYMEWIDIEKIMRRSGVCDNYDNSERLTIYPWDTPCAFWKFRSIEQRLRDYAEGNALREVIIKLNVEVTKRREVR